MPGSDKHSYFPCRAKNSYFPNVVSVKSLKTLVKSYLGLCVQVSILRAWLAVRYSGYLHDWSWIPAVYSEYMNNTDMYYLPSQQEIETTNLKYET